MRIPRFIITLFMISIALIMVSGCAAGPNIAENTPDSDQTIAGFWLGLWHGIIAPFTFILSLFISNIHFYEIHNNGGWYNAGYALGVLIVLGGGSQTRTIRRRERIYVKTQ